MKSEKSSPKFSIKTGDRVKHTKSGATGTSYGPVLQFRVWWIGVDWDMSSKALVLEELLEVVDK